jgi:hypothetical protein
MNRSFDPHESSGSKNITQEASLNCQTTVGAAKESCQVFIDAYKVYLDAPYMIFLTLPLKTLGRTVLLALVRPNVKSVTAFSGVRNRSNE